MAELRTGDTTSGSPPQRRSDFFLWAVLALVGGGLLIVLIANRESGPAVGTRHPAVGKPLPGLALQPLTGDATPVQLADLQGQVALVNFWGTWCPPCRVEFPHLTALWQKYDGRPDFRLLAVSCGGGGPDRDLAPLREATAAFLANANVQMPTYADPDLRSRSLVDQAAGFDVYPTTVILDQTGVIRGKWDGYRPGYERQMEELIVELLGG